MSLRGDANLYRRVLRQARPHWGKIGGIFALDLAGSPLGLLMPLPLKIAVDNAVNAQPFPGILVWALPAAFPNSRSAALAVSAGLLILIAVLTQMQGLAGAMLRTYITEK